MNRILFALALAATAGIPQAAKAGHPYGYDGYDGRGRIVTCESKDERPRHCRVDTRGGVRLVDQRSRAPCIRGRSWGVDRGGIWVDHGCRARFEVGGGYGRPGYGYEPGYGGGYGRGPVVVRCESRDDRPRFCAVDGRIRDVRIERQLSRSRCDYGYSWGFQRNGIWVENGCRADFVVY